MRTALFAVVACGLLGAVGPGARAAEPVSELLGWVPERTNLVLFVDVDGVRNSAAARTGKWGEAHNPATALDALPPGVSRLVVASHFDPGAGTSWEVTVAGLNKPVPDAALFKALGGTPDKIGGKTVALTRKHGYVANLAPSVAGSYQPPNRQEVGRWLREVTGKPAPGLSPYLVKAGAGIGPNAQVVLALDTTEMFDPALVKAGLVKSAALKGKAANAAAVADLFGGMIGVTLSVHVSNKITGEIRLDFDRAPTALGAAAKPLLLEVLERLGLRADEMDDWTLTVKQNAVGLGGTLTQEGARHLLSPVLRPSAGALDQSATAPPDQDPKAAASLRYYQGVKSKMNAVWKSPAPSYAKLTSLFVGAARHIDELPILNVDDELLDWGTAISTTFRTMAIVAQATGGTINLAEANKAMLSVTTPNYYTGFGGGFAAGYYGNYGYGYQYAVPSGSTSTTTIDNYGQVGNFQDMTSQKEALYRRNTWKTIDTATTEIRRKMTKKYGIEFEDPMK